MNANKLNKILLSYGAASFLGVLTGLVGSLFQLAIFRLNQLISSSLTFSGNQGIPPVVMSILISVGLTLTAWGIVKKWAPEASGSGVHEIEGALMNQRPIRWYRLLPAKFFGGISSICAKLVVGREGPTIQMGGNLGEMLSELLRFSSEKRHALIAAGAAAGLATAFNAPLAGVLFVLEEMRTEFNFSFTNFTTVTLACVTATVTLQCIIGPAPAIPMPIFVSPSLKSLGLFFLFGVIVGLVGLLFNKALMKSLLLADKMSLKMHGFYAVFSGILVGYLAYVYPNAVGGGYEIIGQALTFSLPFYLLSLLFVVRFFMTMLCYATNVPGGIFAPMLALGTLLGLACSSVFPLIIDDLSIHPGMFAVAGMGALFAAAVRAPITGIVLVVEMTQNYSLILPLMVTCLTSTLVVQLAGDEPIYTQLLQRVLRQGGQ